MEAFVRNMLEQLSAWPAYLFVIFFFVSGVLQIVFPPYPGDSVLLFGACLQGMGARNGSLAAFSYVLGVMLANAAVFLLAYKLGPRLLCVGFIKKFFPEPLQEKSRMWYGRFGLPLLFLCKFIPGINTVAILIGGVMRQKVALSVVCMSAAALIHGAVFTFVGVRIGGNWQAITGFISRYNHIAVIAAIALLIMWLAYKLIEKKRKGGVA